MTSIHQQNISGITHSFDTGVALKTKSLEAAIIYNHLDYWLRHNALTGQNFRDGKIWVYLSHKQISQYFGYMSIQQVQRALEKLLECGLIVKGNFNKNPFDRTTWYTYSDENLQRNSNKLFDTSKSINGDIEIDKSDLSKSMDVHTEDIKEDEKKNLNNNNNNRMSSSMIRLIFFINPQVVKLNRF